MLKEYLKKRRIRKIYRQRNSHNFTFINNTCNIDKISVGEKSYGQINLFDSSDEQNRLVIGSYCSVGPNVLFLLGGEHNTRTISTYPFKAMIFGYGQEAGSKGDIIVQDDVWIGANAIICSGVTIGQGAVIAAGAVITKNVEPYAVVGGNPARILKYRFSNQLISKLLSIDIRKLLNSFKKEEIEEIYTELTEEQIDKWIAEKKLKNG